MLVIRDGELHIDVPAFRECQWVIVQIGVGGTGGNVLLSMARLLRGFSLKNERINYSYLIADGTTVKEHNLENQQFRAKDIGRKKAEVLAERYYRLLDVPIYVFSEYVENVDTLAKLFKIAQRGQWTVDIPVLLGCVDNNRSRQVFHQYFERAEDLIYIDSGNTTVGGQVIMGVKAGGKEILPPAGKIYTEMLTDKDLFKSEESCDANASRYPQLQVTNEKAADGMVNLLHNLMLYRCTDVHRIEFNTRTIAQQPHFIDEVIMEMSQHGRRVGDGRA